MPVATSTALLVGGSLAAAGATAYAGSQAASAQERAARQAGQAQQRQYEQTRSDLEPYRTTGGNALSQYASLHGLNGRDAYNAALSNYTESPFLSTLVNRARDSVESSRAARGGLFSGGTAQAIGDRTGELYLGDFNNYLGRLGGMADNGQNAAAQTGSFGAQAASGQANSLMAAGNARANNYVNMGNSFNNMLGQLGSVYGALQGGAFGAPSNVNANNWAGMIGGRG